MINPSTTFGKVLLVFFWGGLSAEITLFIMFLVKVEWYFVPFLVVIVNMILIAVKNTLDPRVKFK